jgi:hypothetical protein
MVQIFEEYGRSACKADLGGVVESGCVDGGAVGASTDRDLFTAGAMSSGASAGMY